MEATITTDDLKSKLDHKQIMVVETLAPERYREAHIPSAINIPPEKIKNSRPSCCLSRMLKSSPTAPARI